MDMIWGIECNCWGCLRAWVFHYVLSRCPEQVDTEEAHMCAEQRLFLELGWRGQPPPTRTAQKRSSVTKRANSQYLGAQGSYGYKLYHHRPRNSKQCVLITPLLLLSHFVLNLSQSGT